jgi:hypothetical protein
MKRGFCRNKEQVLALKACGLTDKVIYQDGHGAEDLERCLASFRGRPGTLKIAPDLTVFGESRKAVAAVMDRLERAGIRVVDVVHPQDETIAAMMQRASVLIAHTGLMDRRTAKKRGRRGGIGKGVAAQQRRDGAAPTEFVQRVVAHREIPWRVKVEILGPGFSASTLRRHHGGTA